MSYESHLACWNCSGSGVPAGKCSGCAGTGKMPAGGSPCIKCNGTGICPTCNGR